ncbi:MAG: ChbG/HpnK family deacetylase [Acidobacteria bacterium]|nr:ChbG/HpnK family deacetylase [Acidobacteriota bacterium]
MRQLIVNADDFGYARGVNHGILYAYRQGIVRSTSLLANGVAFQEAAELAQQEPGLDVGCHLNFVEGVPLCRPEQIPHLVSRQGQFVGVAHLARRLWVSGIPATELEREARSQIERLLQAGVQPSHVDTHQHTHAHPQVATAVARVAHEYNIAWLRRPFENCVPRGVERFELRRITRSFLNRLAPRFERAVAAEGALTPDYFSGFLLTGRLNKRALQATLAALRHGITELMCHPGYCDSELQSLPTRLRREREAELEAVADGAWHAQLAEQGIVLTSFRALAVRSGSAIAHSLLAAPTTAGWSLT